MTTQPSMRLTWLRFDHGSRHDRAGSRPVRNAQHLVNNGTQCCSCVRRLADSWTMIGGIRDDVVSYSARVAIHCRDDLARAELGGVLDGQVDDDLSVLRFTAELRDGDIVAGACGELRVRVHDVVSGDEPWRIVVMSAV